MQLLKHGKTAWPWTQLQKKRLHHWSGFDRVRGNWQLANIAYERCRAALEGRGLRASPELERALQAAQERSAGAAGTIRPGPVVTSTGKEERRLVSVLHTDLSVAAGPQSSKDLEELRSIVGAVSGNAR